MTPEISWLFKTTIENLSFAAAESAEREKIRQVETGIIVGPEYSKLFGGTLLKVA